MLSNVKLTKLNTVKHLNCNLTNASFSEPEIKSSSIDSLIMTSKQICISASLKHMLKGTDKKTDKNAITEELILSKGKITAYCNMDKSAGQMSLNAGKQSYKYKGNCGLLKKNYSVSIRDIQSAKSVGVL
ncbi:MAG: hypothetical protein IJ039_02460 [Clostridia bacterium]|nr:hypothetical protein [Clostridia bacterium]